MSTEAAHWTDLTDHDLVTSWGASRRRALERQRHALRWHRAVIAALLGVCAAALYLGPIDFDGSWPLAAIVTVLVFAGPVLLAFAAGAAWEEARARTREGVER